MNKFPRNPLYSDQGLVQDNPLLFDGQSVYLHFKKAKFLGVHTAMYLLPRADRLVGTHLTLNWLKD